MFGARGMMGPAAVEAISASGVEHLLVTDVPVGSGKIDLSQEKRRVAEALYALQSQPFNLAFLLRQS